MNKFLYIKNVCRDVFYHKDAEELKRVILLSREVGID
jgi:hypothetical protein